MAKLRVEVVYARPEGHDSVSLIVESNATLAGAVAASGLLSRHPELQADRLRLGVHGEEKPQEAPAREGDRIEIYRPLVLDPKEARRGRAARARRRG